MSLVPDLLVLLPTPLLIIKPNMFSMTQTTTQAAFDPFCKSKCCPL